MWELGRLCPPSRLAQSDFQIGENYLGSHGPRMWTLLLEIPTDRLVVFAVAVGKPLQAPAKQVKPLCFGLLLLSQATLVKRGPQLA